MGVYKMSEKYLKLRNEELEKEIAILKSGKIALEEKVNKYKQKLWNLEDELISSQIPAIDSVRNTAYFLCGYFENRDAEISSSLFLLNTALWDISKNIQKRIEK